MAKRRDRARPAESSRTQPADNARPATRPAIAAPWIKAHAVGGAVFVAVALLGFVLGRLLGVNGEGASLATQTVFVLIATAALASGIFVLGLQTGGVLRSQLPAFPTELWLTFHVVLGIVIGTVLSLDWVSPEMTAETEIFEFQSVAILTAIVAAGLAAIGALAGGVQALILRRAASGSGLWIACCAVAWALLAVVVPVVAYGPQAGFAKAVAFDVVILIVLLLAAMILLPAARRLRPR